MKAISTVLPTQSSLNVNTAPEIVLHTFFPNASSEAMKTLLRQRTAAPFETIEAFLLQADSVFGTDGMSGAEIQNLSVKSKWFSTEMNVKVGAYSTARVTVQYRNPKTGQTRVVLRKDAHP